MTDHIADLNAALREFRGAVCADGSIADQVRCCLIGFAETARVLHPLRSTGRLAELPEPRNCVGTNFGPVFLLLRDMIDRDVHELDADRLPVRQPIVLFLSDGQPTDPVTWPVALAALTDPNWAARPNLITFGIGDADRQTLGRIGTFRTSLGRDEVRMSSALIAAVQSASLDRV